MELRVTDLTCRRGEARVLAGVAFSVPPGRALVLRGPNGAGKTTLLRTLAGLSPASTGTVAPGPDAMAFATHADGLKAQLSVAENLTFWSRAFGTGDAGVARAVDAFALGGLLTRRAADLSAGQRRRAGLARMVLTGRPIWLMDEPTVSLDAAAVAGFAEVVRGHLAAGGIALVATHIDLGLEAEVLEIARFAAGRAQAGLSQAGSDPFAEAVE